jgi:5-methylcytosine-specific restriction protein A
MPTAPPTRCGRVGCSNMATKRGRCDDCQPQPWHGRPSPQQRYGMSSGTMRALKRQVMARDNGCCYICGREGAEELEHKTPISQGGAPRDLNNLGVVHADCHRIKSRQEAIEGARRLRSSRD